MTSYPLSTQESVTQAIITALLKLQSPQTVEEELSLTGLYPTILDGIGESWFQCHFTGCDERAFFPVPPDNGGICHSSECAYAIATRIANLQGEPNFFDQLALKSLLHQVANIERYPQKRHPEKPDTWIPFCPFCSVLQQVTQQKRQDGYTTITYMMPHTPECIVTRAMALENGGAR